MSTPITPTTSTVAGNGDQPLDSLSATATRELADAFATAMSTGDPGLLETVLGEHVIYQVPGRSVGAGVHRGRHQTIAMLTIAATAGTEVTGVDVTEVMADGHRAFCTFFLRGTSHGRPFGFEVAFHLATDGESIIGVTEYSGDQYVVDELLGVPEPARHESVKRRRFRRS